MNLDLVLTDEPTGNLNTKFAEAAWSKMYHEGPARRSFASQTPDRLHLRHTIKAQGRQNDARRSLDLQPYAESFTSPGELSASKKVAHCLGEHMGHSPSK